MPAALAFDAASAATASERLSDRIITKKSALARKILVSAKTLTKTIRGIASAHEFEPATTTDTDIAIAVAVNTTTRIISDFRESSS
jgi:hypothetical protein